eukprot:5527867-Pyramimonas_sp.AAC.1
MLIFIIGIPPGPRAIGPRSRYIPASPGRGARPPASPRGPPPLDAETKISPDLAVRFFVCRAEEKIAALMYLVRELINKEEQTIVFASTKHHVEYLGTLMRDEGVQVALVYGEMDQ